MCRTKPGTKSAKHRDKNTEASCPILSCRRKIELNPFAGLKIPKFVSQVDSRKSSRKDGEDIDGLS
jgi:hypothetical protein